MSAKVVAQRRRANGEGSIFVHSKSGLWCFTVDLGRNIEGKRIRRTIYGRTRAAVLQKVADERARFGGSLHPKVPDKLCEWVEHFFDTEVWPNKAAATGASYESVWRLHVAPYIGEIRLDALTVDHAVYLTQKLRAEGRSSSMIARTLRVMHRVIAVAIRQNRYHGKNPFGLVDKPRSEARERRWLSVDESKRLAVAAGADRYEALWIILLTGGLRLGEALALKWTDIDFSAKTIFVQRSRSEAGPAGPHDKETKNRSSRRIVSIGQLAVDALLRRREAAATEGHASPFVFVTMRGTVVLQSNVRRKHFAPLLKRAGLPHIRIHDLRHAHASIGIASGVSPKAMADRLGHATTTMTMAVYAHTLAGEDRTAADALDAAIGR